MKFLEDSNYEIYEVKVNFKIEISQKKYYINIQFFTKIIRFKLCESCGSLKLRKEIKFEHRKIKERCQSRNFYIIFNLVI